MIQIGDILFCGNCGNKLNENDRFCSSCGKINDSYFYSDIEDKIVEEILMNSKNQEYLNGNVDFKTFLLCFIFNHNYFFYKKMYFYAVLWFFLNVVFLITNPLMVIISCFYFPATFNYCYKWNLKMNIRKFRHKFLNVNYEQLVATFKSNDNSTNIGGAVIFAIVSTIIYFLIFMLLI